MLILYGRAKGQVHKERKLPCQDDVRLKIIPFGFIFAIADGAGSAPLSHLGAYFATKGFVNFISKVLEKNTNIDFQLLRQLIKDAFIKAREELKKVAERKNVALKALHTTLYAGCYYKEQLICAGIGDSFGLVITSSNEIMFPVEPCKGEFINETVFITMDKWKEFLNISPIIRSPKAFIAFSDGLLNIIYSMKYQEGVWQIIPDREFIGRLIKYICENSHKNLKKEFLIMLSSSRAQELNDDDKALLVAIFKEH